jgi:NAD(P)-dependent dehydrogenase (short-subunit alcohol dehydrogenase family)
MAKVWTIKERYDLGVRVDSGDSRKELLILGGSSSIAKPIIETAIAEGYKVCASFRDSKKTWEHEHLTWIYLDTGKLDSVENFLNEISPETADRVISLIGALSGIELTETDRDKFELYLLEQLINPSYLIIRIFEILDPNSQMLIMSSRAARKSFDFSYSMVKSGLESLVLSLRTRSKYNNVNYVRCGLILNSAMYFEMTEVDRIRHTVQSSGTLLSLDSAASEIWQIFDQPWDEKEGFFLGREY